MIDQLSKCVGDNILSVVVYVIYKYVNMHSLKFMIFIKLKYQSNLQTNALANIKHKNNYKIIYY